jgi:hypothetical protein
MLLWLLATIFAMARSSRYAHPRNASVVSSLRQHLLKGLDSFVPPSTDGVHGTTIGVQYRFFKVIKVDMAQGQLVLKVWRRMRWRDDRLRWDPAEWSGITQVMIHPGAHTGGAADTIDNNMWTPQIVLYNGITPIEETMEDGAAWVNDDGAVWHSAPGVIDVTCRFAGLQMFPRDSLECPIEIASWSYGDLVTNLTFMTDRDCVDLTVENPTAGTTYQEYLLHGYTCVRNTRTYPCCGEEPFSQLVVKLSMSRASAFYVLVIELPGILLTSLSFATLFLDAANVGVTRVHTVPSLPRRSVPSAH